MAVKKDILLEVVSAEQTLASCKVDSVELPGTLGRFEVLPDHAPLLSSLAPGEIVFTASGKTDRIPVRGGFVEVADNHVSVCVEV